MAFCFRESPDFSLTSSAHAPESLHFVFALLLGEFIATCHSFRRIVRDVLLCRGTGIHVRDFMNVPISGAKLHVRHTCKLK